MPGSTLPRARNLLLNMEKIFQMRMIKVKKLLNINSPYLAINAIKPSTTSLFIVETVSPGCKMTLKVKKTLYHIQEQ